MLKGLCFFSSCHALTWVVLIFWHESHHSVLLKGGKAPIQQQTEQIIEFFFFFNAWHLGGIFYIFTQPTVDDRKVPRHAEGGYCADPGKVWDFVNQKGGHPVARLCPLLGKRLEIWLSTIRLRRVLTRCLADSGLGAAVSCLRYVGGEFKSPITAICSSLYDLPRGPVDLNPRLFCSLAPGVQSMHFTSQLRLMQDLVSVHVFLWLL